MHRHNNKHVSAVMPVSPVSHIELNITNSVSLRGEITDESISRVIEGILLNEPTYMYIDSDGGSVMAGIRLLEVIKNYKIKCIANKAYSMAFVILQACNKRHIMSTSSVMQHQMSLGLKAELVQMKNFLSMVSAMEKFLNAFQSKRIGIDEQEFERLVLTEWWLFGNDIVSKGVADSVVSVSCSKELILSRINVSSQEFIFEITKTFSGCPLLTNELTTR